MIVAAFKVFGHVCLAVADALTHDDDLFCQDVAIDEPRALASLCIYRDGENVTIEAEAVGGHDDGTRIVKFSVSRESAMELSQSVAAAATDDVGD